MGIDRAQRAEILRQAKAVSRACQRGGMDVQDTCAEILAKTSGVLPLEAWRLACGWSRARVIEEIAALYAEDGLEPPDVNTAMLCKWEHGQGAPGPVYGQVLCRLYGVSAEHLGLQVPKPRASSGCPPQPVVNRNGNFSDERENPMRRRTLIVSAALSVPLHLLQDLEDALAVPVQPGRPEGLAEIQKRLLVARHQFDTAALTPLIGAFPAMLAAAEDAAKRVNSEAGWALLASCHNLATDALNKIGRKETAYRTADRGVQYAERSGDPVAMGASARAMGMMLRTTGRHQAASQVVGLAADRLEATGLRKASQVGVYVRLLCTAAYSAAGAGDRKGAFDRIVEAEQAADRLAALTKNPEAATSFVQMYEMNVHYVMGDAGAALHVGKGLHPDMYPTPERRGRLFTDLARAWWMWGKPEQTADALLSAYRETPSEVRDRPSIRKIADDLTALHPSVPGVRQLSVALAGGRPLM